MPQAEKSKTGNKTGDDKKGARPEVRRPEIKYFFVY
jgi:hypothetical protein